MFASDNLFAQTTAGKDFWVAFGQFRGVSSVKDLQNVDIQIRIVTTADTKVRFDFTANNTSRTLRLRKNDVHLINFNIDEKKAVYTALPTTSTVTTIMTKNSLHITSDQPISVYALIRWNHAADVTNVLPTNSFGTDYYHISYNTGKGDGERDGMTLVATENGTNLAVYQISNNNILKGNGSINKGGVWYMPSPSDMTGYHIVSNKPIAHFVTHQGTMIPDKDRTNIDNLFQQMAPVNSWGKVFFVPSLPYVTNGGQDGLRIRIVASQNETKITQTGGKVMKGSTSLQKGGFVELEIDSDNKGCFITSNKPVGVCSFLLSYSPHNNTVFGGPANVWIPPVEQSIPITTVVPFIHESNTITEHYALIVTPNATKNATKVNGSILTSGWVTRSKYAFTQYPLSKEDMYTFSNPAGLTVLVAGLGHSESYYYLAGASMYNLNMAFTVNGINYQQIAGKTLCSNISFNAKVEYAKNPLDLKWFINGALAQQGKLSWNTVLAAGNYTVRMEVMDLNGVIQKITTNFTVETPVITVPSEIQTGKTVSLTSSTVGTWTSNNPAIATVTSDGRATGIAAGNVQFIFISTAKCVSISDIVVVKSGKNDTIALLYNDSVSFDVFADGAFNCAKNVASLTVEDQAMNGIMTHDVDNIFTYKPKQNRFGIDSVRYSVKCNASGDSHFGKVYFIVSKPLSRHNVACPAASLEIGMNHIENVEYYWYNSLEGNDQALQNPADVLSVVKDGSDMQTWYVEARYKGFKSTRYPLSARKSDNCAPANPSGCFVDGQLLFSENFGGNKPDHLLVFDADNAPGQIYEHQIDGLCTGMKLHFSAWIVCLTKNTADAGNANLIFSVEDLNKNILTKYYTGDIPNMDTEWKSYGFECTVPENESSVILRIENNCKDSKDDDFAIDDIEIRMCVPPVTFENKLLDTVCVDSLYVFKVSYSDDGTFTASEKKLVFHWEHSNDGNNWSVIGSDSTVAETYVSSTYIINNITNGNHGYYRFIVSNPATTCRVVSKAISLDVVKMVIVPDLRIMIAPSTSSHKVYLTSFIDTLNIASVKWLNPDNIPKFTNDVTGELDAQKFAHKRVYTYKYTVASKCGNSSAKVYVFTSQDKLPVKNNKQIFVCKDLELSKHVQLNQILGLENNGTWTYPHDPNDIIINNVRKSSAKFGSSMIFNAQKAYDEAGNEYDSTGKSGYKAFQFKYTQANNEIIEFTIVVGG
ncbi:MAG: hypothetical protein LBS43_06385 [Prevotellaceae bacterium]|nr:hypothetical protein [Prevotellaceae bacterium]